MEDYKPNSHRFREEQKPSAEEKRVIRTINGKTKTKKNEFRKFTSFFISDDIHSVRTYVVEDVIIPTIKKTILNSLEMILLGKSGSYGNSGVRAGGTKVSYRNYYDDHRDDRRPTARTPFTYDDIIFETRGDAEMVIDEMGNIIERYGFVTVADLYDIAQLTAPHTSNKYGWTSIRSAEAVRVSDGYVIKLPRAMPID